MDALTKAGIKTSEFWITALVVLGAALEALQGQSNGTIATIAGAAAAIVYTIMRTISKAKTPAPTPGETK